MALDSLFGRRKRNDNGAKAMAGGLQKLGEPDGFKGGMSVKPGTSAFGLRARTRNGLSAAEIAEKRRGKTDLRVKTAYRTVGKATAEKNKYLAGD